MHSNILCSTFTAVSSASQFSLLCSELVYWEKVDLGQFGFESMQCILNHLEQEEMQYIKKIIRIPISFGAWMSMAAWIACCNLIARLFVSLLAEEKVSLVASWIWVWYLPLSLIHFEDASTNALFEEEENYFDISMSKKNTSKCLFCACSFSSLDAWGIVRRCIIYEIIFQKEIIWEKNYNTKYQFTLPFFDLIIVALQISVRMKQAHMWASCRKFMLGIAFRYNLV